MAGIGWATNNLREGRKVRRSVWTEDLHLFIKEDELMIGEDKPWEPLSDDVLAQDWESYMNQDKATVQAVF